MNKLDKKEFSSLLLMTGEIYSKQLSTGLVVMYFDYLSKYSIEQLTAAFKKHSLDPNVGQYFPKPSDIVRNITGDKASTKNNALIAWAAVEAAISSVGSYGTLKLDDKQAMMVIRTMGSWSQFCQTDRDKMTFKKQEFIGMYEAFNNTAIEDMPDCLMGIEDLANQRKLNNTAMGSLMDGLRKRETKKLN